MTSRDLCEIRREAFTNSAEGVPIKTWTTAARGALPALAVACRIQAASVEEIVSMGLRGECRPVKLYFSSEPTLTAEDVVVISSVIYRVVTPSHQFDSQNRLWRAFCEHETNAD